MQYFKNLYSGPNLPAPSAPKLKLQIDNNLADPSILNVSGLMIGSGLKIELFIRLCINHFAGFKGGS